MLLSFFLFEHLQSARPLAMLFTYFPRQPPSQLFEAGVIVISISQIRALNHSEVSCPRSQLLGQSQIKPNPDETVQLFFFIRLYIQLLIKIKCHLTCKIFLHSSILLHSGIHCKLFLISFLIYISIFLKTVIILGFFIYQAHHLPMMVHMNLFCLHVFLL